MPEHGDSLTTEDLVALGFERAAVWEVDGEWLDYRFETGAGERMDAVFSAGNALYAFASGDEILYIGKTTQTLKKRIQGYRKPGRSQRTNQKCHDRIRSLLAEGHEVELLAFAPPEDLQFRGFSINLAGGLEDILISTFDPPWNGGGKGVATSESAEREAEQLDQDGAEAGGAPTEQEIGQFTITLTPTYYRKGIINPGQAVSHLFGATDETVTLSFSDGTRPVAARIDRRANRNGAVRFVGSNQAIANWLQKHFQPGDVVSVRILTPHLVEFVARLQTH